jgi:YbbR domain-containing protein
MTSEDRQSRLWVRIITDNLGLKAIALGLSLLLFYLVHSDVDAQRSVYVDVVALLPPPGSGKMLISELPAQVKVTLRGSRSKLSSLSRDELSPIQLDLRDDTSGHYYLDASALDVGSNVQVVEMSPSMIPLTWATAAEKRVPVEAQYEGELDRGLQIAGEPEIEPSYVTLRGPEQALEKMTLVSTEPISLLRLENGMHVRKVPLEPLPEHLTYAEDTAVEVRLQVAPATAEQSFKRLEIAALGDAKVALRPGHVAVTLRGPEELIEELDAEALVPYVEIDPAQSPGNASYDVRLRGVPEGFEVLRIVPSSVIAQVKGVP